MLTTKWHNNKGLVEAKGLFLALGLSLSNNGFHKWISRIDHKKVEGEFWVTQLKCLELIFGSKTTSASQIKEAVTSLVFPVGELDPKISGLKLIPKEACLMLDSLDSHGVVTKQARQWIKHSKKEGTEFLHVVWDNVSALIPDNYEGPALEAFNAWRKSLPDL